MKWKWNWNHLSSQWFACMDGNHELRQRYLARWTRFVFKTAANSNSFLGGREKVTDQWRIVSPLGNPAGGCGLPVRRCLPPPKVAIGTYAETRYWRLFRIDKKWIDARMLPFLHAFADAEYRLWYSCDCEIKRHLARASTACEPLERSRKRRTFPQNY